MYTIEEFDQCKTKVLKYVLYKKRTEREIRQKFEGMYDSELFEDVIADLKENGYISDENYIQRAIYEFMALHNLSLKEIRYKLYAKGISKEDFENFLENNLDELEEYEIQSASDIYQKKVTSMEENEIRNYLIKKGYTKEAIDAAFDDGGRSCKTY